MSKTFRSVSWRVLDRMNATPEGLLGRKVVPASRLCDKSNHDQDRSGRGYEERSGDAMQRMRLNESRTGALRKQRAENWKNNVYRPRSSRAGRQLWTQQKSSRGRTYYFNHGTNQSQWEIPEGFHVETPKCAPDCSGCTRNDSREVVNGDSRIPRKPSPIPTNESFAEPARGLFESNFSSESMPLRGQIFLPSHDHNIGSDVSFRRVTRISRIFGTPSPEVIGESAVRKQRTPSKDVHFPNPAYPNKTPTQESGSSGIEALELKARQLAIEILENKHRIETVSDSLREAKFRSRIERMRCFLNRRRQKALEHEMSDLGFNLCSR